MVLIITLLALLVALTYYFVTFKQKYWATRNVFGPRPQFFIGNMPSIVTQRTSIAADLAVLYEKYKNQHRAIGIYAMLKPKLLLMDPELVKEALVRQFKSFHASEFSGTLNKEFDPLIGRNPIVLDGDEWKQKRGEISPAFTSFRLKALYPCMEEVCHRLRTYLNKKLKDDNELDTRELAARYTIDVVANCIYGVDAATFTSDHSLIREMALKLMQPNLRTIFVFMLALVYPGINNYLKVSMAERKTEQFFIDLLKNAVELRKNSKIERQDFLGHLMQLREKHGLSEVEMAAHTVTFFTDGFDTSSVAVAQTLYELARNPIVQDKLRAELNAISKDGKISFDQLNDFEYLDVVFHEALRLHPPGVFTSRCCTEATSLVLSENQRVRIEKGVVVVVPIREIHRDATYYDEPEEFRPERFEDGKLKEFKDKGLYLTFGDGPRMCLGQKFAILQAKACIFEIIRNFRVYVSGKMKDPLVIDPKEFLNVPIGGIWLKYEALTL